MPPAASRGKLSHRAAGLHFLAPAVKTMLVLMWMASSILDLWQGTAETQRFVRAVGLPPSWADPLDIGSSLQGFVLGLLIVQDRHARWSTLVQVAVVLGYTIVFGLSLPMRCLDPALIACVGRMVLVADWI